MFEIEVPERSSSSLKLFELDGAWHQCGSVYNRSGRGCGDVWDAYTLGYKDAVKCLIRAVELGEFSYTTFGYPIFFLTQQYLELRMKEIIKNGRPLTGDNSGLQKGHDLVQLWSECKKVLKKLEGWDEYNDLSDEAQQNFRTLDHFIHEMNQDPHGQSFRYPVDRDGKPLLYDESIQVLNVKNLATVFDWISMELEGFSTEIDEKRKVWEEHLHECGGEDFS